MKAMHAGAAVCFVMAFVCYLLAWLPGAFGLAFCGVVFEIAALLQIAGHPTRTSDE